MRKEAHRLLNHIFWRITQGDRETHDQADAEVVNGCARRNGHGWVHLEMDHQGVKEGLVA